MSSADSLQTWELLKEFGFRPDPSVISDIHPGLSFDFGNFALSASAVMSRGFQEVVLFTCVRATPRTLAEVQFEMPRQLESREKCAAWLAWNLDRHGDHVFQPRNSVPWLEQGRTNLRLLPWYYDREAYESRPHCSADKELARPLLKALAKLAGQMPVDESVWFSFDGEVLKVRAGTELLAIAARGRPWPNQFGLKAGQLRGPLRRIAGPSVCFESWEAHFTVAGRRYDGVTVKPVENS